MPKRRRHRHQNRPRAPRPLVPEPSTAEVQQVPCEAHDAAQGVPCYRHAVGVCAGRVRAWLTQGATGTAKRPAERPAPAPEVQTSAEPQRPTQIIPEDVRSSTQVDMDRLSPLERHAAEIRAAQREREAARATRAAGRREQDQAEAVRRERLAQARRHWEYVQQTPDHHYNPHYRAGRKLTMNTTTTTTTEAESQTYTILPCGTCGVQVHNPAEVYTVKSTAKESTVEGRTVAVPHFGRERRPHELTTCETCVEYRDQADKITAQHPGAEQTSVAVQVRVCVAAIDALGLGTGYVPPARSKRALRRLLDHLLPVTGGLLYSDLLTPTVRRDSTVHTGAGRWEHLTEDHRHRITSTYGTMLKASLETRGPVYCPSGGCLFCGVRSIPAMPSQAPNVWREVTTTRGSLGARRKRSQRVTGHLCPDCYQAREDVGAWGPTAIETAIFQYLVYTPGLNRPELNAPAWGALNDAEPNATPWEHLGDLDALRDDLRSHL